MAEKEENRDQDKYELEIREINKAVDNLMSFERSDIETDLILKIRACAETLLNFNKKEE